MNRLRQDGALTLTEISKRAGHASTAMTLNRYSHPMPDRDEARRKALGSMWEAATSTDDLAARRRDRLAE